MNVTNTTNTSSAYTTRSNNKNHVSQTQNSTFKDTLTHTESTSKEPDKDSVEHLLGLLEKSGYTNLSGEEKLLTKEDRELFSEILRDRYISDEEILSVTDLQSKKLGNIFWMSFMDNFKGRIKADDYARYELNPVSVTSNSNFNEALYRTMKENPGIDFMGELGVNIAQAVNGVKLHPSFILDGVSGMDTSYLKEYFEDTSSMNINFDAFFQEILSYLQEKIERFSHDETWERLNKLHDAYSILQENYNKVKNETENDA